MYKIWIINRQSCCFAEIPELHIELRNSGQARAARCKVYNWKIQLKRLIICEPTIMATSLTIFAKGADTLTLCEVLVTSAGIHMILNLIHYYCNCNGFSSQKRKSCSPRFFAHAVETLHTKPVSANSLYFIPNLVALGRFHKNRNEMVNWNNYNKTLLYIVCLWLRK